MWSSKKKKEKVFCFSFKFSHNVKWNLKKTKTLVTNRDLLRSPPLTTAWLVIVACCHKQNSSELEPFFTWTLTACLCFELRHRAEVYRQWKLIRPNNLRFQRPLTAVYWGTNQRRIISNVDKHSRDNQPSFPATPQCLWDPFPPAPTSQITCSRVLLFMWTQT